MRPGGHGPSRQRAGLLQLLAVGGEGPVGGLADGGDAVVQAGAGAAAARPGARQGPGTVVESVERSDNLGDGETIVDQGLAVAPEASAVGACQLVGRSAVVG